MSPLTLLSLLALSLTGSASPTSQSQSTNGQILTPGIAILDAPQPGTPLGGASLHVALDVTSNGRVALPPYADGARTAIHNITLFLSSYETGRNFTISNGTATGGGDIMALEQGSTVKHVDWVWPDCLVGDGQPEGNDSARGAYNISIRQNFRCNNMDFYTIRDVPISVTNSIQSSSDRPSCDAINNPILTPEEIDAEGANSGTCVIFIQQDSQQDDADAQGGAGLLSWANAVHTSVVVAAVVALPHLVL